MLRRIAIRLHQADKASRGSFTISPRRSCHAAFVASYSTSVEVVQPPNDFWGDQLTSPRSTPAGPSSSSNNERIVTSDGRPASSSWDNHSSDPNYDSSPLDAFFDGHSTSISTTPSPVTHAAPPTELPKYIPLGTHAPAELASYVIPEGSGVSMIRSFIEEYKFLSTQQIWHMGTEGLKPELQPSHVVEIDGRIRMKWVSTWREQRRIWRPPPKERFPHHPFKSVKCVRGL
jgi:hypothetical protein